MFRSFALIAVASCASAASASIYNLQSDWSELSNPFGPWGLREGLNYLPHVDAWQRVLGGWSTFQPGWARSEDANTRLPFFFKSNGSETFGHDWSEGEVVVHTTDPGNGVGSGHANVIFTVQQTGTLSVTGGLWIGRDIGRSMNWEVFLNGTILTGGFLASGDAYSSANPFEFNQGYGGTNALTNLSVTAGDVLELRFTTQTNAGDFVVIDMTVENIPAPGAVAGLLTMGLMSARRRR
ncbi:MAG: hypothetical protein KJZ65_02100 [Phycisphaerales bacterium]|nr:hypothetical protein [Phycisphaerales bacterium]